MLPWETSKTKKKEEKKNEMKFEFLCKSQKEIFPFLL